MRAGRIAGDGDLLGIDAERRRVRAQPAQRRFHVVDLRRPDVLARQPVFGTHADVTVARELNAIAAQLAAIAVLPTAAVDQQHRRAVGARIGRREYVAMEVAPAAGAEHDVLFDADSTRKLGDHLETLQKRQRILQSGACGTELRSVWWDGASGAAEVRVSCVGHARAVPGRSSRGHPWPRMALRNTPTSA